MTRLEDIAREIREIQKRNALVEQDKRWETSAARKTLLILFTYLTIGFYLSAIKVENPWVNAIVPAIGFFLSTLTLPFFKSMWQKFGDKHI